ncbi:hypothetical protein TURU_108563 [Turdus rufiventris]|nr:hypothetical protein TURU_108563 [Turdus rufiventris]
MEKAQQSFDISMLGIFQSPVGCSPGVSSSPPPRGVSHSGGAAQAGLEPPSLEVSKEFLELKARQLEEKERELKKHDAYYKEQLARLEERAWRDRTQGMGKGEIGAGIPGWAGIARAAVVVPGSLECRRPGWTLGFGVAWDNGSPEEALELLQGWSQAGGAGNVLLEKGRMQGELPEHSRAWRGSMRAGEGLETRDRTQGMGKGEIGEGIPGLELPENPWIPGMSKSKDGTWSNLSAQFYKVTTEQYQKAADEVSSRFKRYESHPICGELQDKILQCYRDHAQETLSCSALASQYLHCVNHAKQRAKELAEPALPDSELAAKHSTEEKQTFLRPDDAVKSGEELCREGRIGMDIPQSQNGEGWEGPLEVTSSYSGLCPASFEYLQGRRLHSSSGEICSQIPPIPAGPPEDGDDPVTFL